MFYTTGDPTYTKMILIQFVIENNKLYISNIAAKYVYKLSSISLSTLTNAWITGYYQYVASNSNNTGYGIYDLTIEINYQNPYLIQYNVPAQYWIDIASSSDGQYIYACAIYQNIYMSSDYGATWSKTTAPTGKNYISICCSGNGQIVLAVLNDNQVSYISNDYGSTWTSIDYPTGYLYDVEMSSNGQYMISTIFNVDTRFWTGVWISTNSGSSWSRIERRCL